jgi:hypothetical protein
LEGLCIYWRALWKWILKAVVWLCGVDSCGSGW